MLCTGRSGSTTFHRACSHITNYTTSHERNTAEVGPDRLRYPPDHIEVDNRLSWFLGRLDERFGDDAFYVHLTRDERSTAESFSRRWAGRYSIIRAYGEGILRRKDRSDEISLDYVRTVNANIAFFLRARSRAMTIRLEEATEAFPTFWERIEAEGDLDAAIAEFGVRHNPSARRSARAWGRLTWAIRSVFRS